ncbi:MAG: hypothetical protein ACREVP_12415 [Burkholderiales bacterium]
MRGAIVVVALSAAMIGAPLVLGGGGLWAKLPAPTEEQKAAAAAKAAKASAAAKHQAELLGKAQDMTVERYKKSHPMKAGPAMATPAAAKK